MTDNVNQPAHYTAGGIETIDVIESVFSKYDHRDQVEKYNQRAHLKGNFKQDLEKARWYLNRTIENCENGKLDPVTGALVGTAEQVFSSQYANNLDTNTIYRDDDGDIWVYDYQEELWHFYRMDGDKVAHKSGRGFSKNGMAVFTRDFFSQVPSKLPILLAIAEYDTDNKKEEKVEEPEIEIVLGETHPADMPVGTTAYRDGARLSYYVRKEADGWILSHCGFSFYNSDSLVASWFKNEEGWSLEKPSDVYKDSDGDFWTKTSDGWRWHNILNGELIYTSIRTYDFEDVDKYQEATKLNDQDALRVRRIIQEGEK